MQSLSLWGEKSPTSHTHRTRGQRHKASLSFVGIVLTACFIRMLNLQMLNQRIFTHYNF